MNSNLSEKVPTKSPNRFKFKIIHLFYGIAVLSSGLALMGPSSIAVSLVSVAFWLTAHYIVSTSKQSLGCFILIWIAGFLLAALLFLPAVQVVRESSRYMACRNNIRQLILSMHNYQSSNLKFPRAFQADANGKPMHSWRVRILPFVDEPALYAAYRFDEPWDGPNNSKLAAQRPDIFRCPSASLGADQTTYKLITGPGTGFPDGESLSFNDILDGTANTIAIIEDPTNPVNWMEPTDASVDEAIAALVGEHVQHYHRTEGMFTTTYRGSNVAMFDGSCHSIRPNANPELIRSAILINDGVELKLDSIIGDFVVHKPAAYLALAVYLILLALPGYFIWQRSQFPQQESEDLSSAQTAKP